MRLSRWAGLLVAGSLLLGSIGQATAHPLNTALERPSIQVSSHTAASVESALVIYINRERAKVGRRPLTVDPKLTRVARLKAQDMVTKRYFSHTSPTYGTVPAMLRRFGIRYYYYGENIGKGRTAYQIHGMLMASSAHRGNILNPRFTHVGVGAVKGPYGYTVSELFIGR